MRAETDIAAASAPHFERRVHCLLGLPFDALSLPQAVGAVARAAAQRQRCFLSTPNLNFVIACLDDADFRRSVIDSDLSVVDGMPLVWLARLLGLPLRERVAGAEIFEGLREASSAPLRVYFFGGPEGAAQAAAERINAERGGLRCVGYEYPGFASVEAMSAPAVLERINRSAADFLIVALGAKKGQAWITRNLAQLSVPVVSHLGAVVNFAAGSLRRAPRWMRRSGLEWLWRIIEEPTLWRRYWHDGLSLLRLLATRVLPGAIYQWFMRLAYGGEPARMDIENQGKRCLVCLRGAWRETDLPPLRAALRQAAAAECEIELDTAGVGYIDSAFAGLLLLAAAYQRHHGRGLRLSKPGARARRTLYFMCADYLLR